MDGHVCDRNETKPACRVQGPRLKGKGRYEWRQQHYLPWLHLIYRPTLFLGLSYYRFPGPAPEMQTKVGNGAQPVHSPVPGRFSRCGSPNTPGETPPANSKPSGTLNTPASGRPRTDVFLAGEQSPTVF